MTWGMRKKDTSISCYSIAKNILSVLIVKKQNCVTIFCNCKETYETSVAFKSLKYTDTVLQHKIVQHKIVVN